MEKRKKFYLREEDRNEEEKRTEKASYSSVINRYFSDLVLCNNIEELDPSIWDNIEVGDITYYMDNDGNYKTQEEYENDETGTIDIYYDEVYQYFLCNLSKWDLDYIRDFKSDSIIVSYSDMLDCNVLMVTHWGTSWKYVLTDIDLTEDINE